MLLFDKSIEFISQKACFLAIKGMLLSAENRKKTARFVNLLYFFLMIHPSNLLAERPGVSRLLLEDDKNFG